MGYKAQIRDLQKYNEYLQNRCNAMEGMVKQLVLTMSEDGEITVPMYDFHQINKVYKMEASGTDDELTVTVTRRESGKD